ncbi:DUF4190 domain-containing protein [uncultured Mycolicibacterium sp.]|uniref:DUF4190 domain-containing protein n=1 Tax=uncultured Mycolicibacterium sp. TaxID=2320817 RepID=UPI00262A55ED|nr:DUF4190 domain-containing protein [uncultured Mycolicibacterium sp.]
MYAVVLLPLLAFLFLQLVVATVVGVVLATARSAEPVAAPPVPVTDRRGRMNRLALLAPAVALVFPIAAIELGWTARRQIRASGERGRGLALAAIVIGAVMTALVVVFCIHLQLSSSTLGA